MPRKGAYYNEIDPYAAQWLRNLIAAGHIAPGFVDERSILDVSPDDLAGYSQCHFFAGIGVWSHALRRAGWSDDRQVWTGSCPCQPFSAAGLGAGFDDERHLWPYWHFLIEQCRPPVVFGEQVEAAIRHGWLDLVQADMEGIHYAFGAVGVPAAGVGAPHIRQRIYFVADTDDAGFGTRREGRPPMGYRTPPESDRSLSQLGNADDEGFQVRSLSDDGGRVVRVEGPAFGQAEPVRGFWSGADWIACRDGKWRPVEPGTFPLAHGAPARVGRLRAYGNAICAEVAAQFVTAYQESKQ